MRTGGKKSGLFRFLAENYVFFTAMNLAVLAGVSLLLSVYGDRVAPTPDAAGLLDALERTEDGNLSGLAASRWLGTDFGLMVFDGEGNLLACQGDAAGKEIPERTAACIPEYASDSRILAAGLPEGSENGRYLLTQVEYTQDERLAVTGYAFLDADRKWVSGTILQREEAFSREELEYLMGRDGQGRGIYRHSYRNPDGQGRLAVFWMREAGTEEYRLFYRAAESARWLLVPVYAGTAAVCIFWLSRRVKRLLAPLNAAAENLAQRRPSGLADYEGPAEFRELADNFLFMERELKRSEEERARLDAEKRKLLADISHDLKTPATVIQGYADALRDGLVPPENAGKYLDAISQRAAKVSELLQTFHEYSKLDRPDFPIRREEMDLCAAVREYFADRYQELEMMGYPVDADIPEEEIRIRADRALLGRAFENLVNNAAAYNPAGTTVFVKVERQGKRAVVRIGDDGRGIPEELRKTLFLPFVTGDAARGSGHGSGLGLSITERILKLHGGSIRLNEAPEAPLKTEFLLIFPL